MANCRARLPRAKSPQGNHTEPISKAGALSEIRRMTRIEERGLARLRLRFPDWRARFDLVSSQAFLEICEAYELACVALDHWTKSDAPTSSAMVEEYKELVASLERDAQLLAAPKGGDETW